MYTHSMATIYLYLSAQVAVGTFFMKSPICIYLELASGVYCSILFCPQVALAEMPACVARLKIEGNSPTELLCLKSKQEVVREDKRKISFFL